MNINKAMRKNRELHKRLSRRLAVLQECDGYRLIIDERGNCCYYSRVRFGENNNKKEYLGTYENKIVRALKEKRFIEQALIQLDRCIRKEQQLSEVQESFDAEALNASLPKAYRLSEKHLRELIGKSDAQLWQEQALKRKNELDAELGVRNPHELKHVANNGLRVRSKSEVIIANILLAFGIAFVYEMPIQVCGSWFHPDFTIYCPRTGRVIIWEHAGMLGKENYRADFAWKMDKYCKAKFVPNVNLILSFEDNNGNINAEAIVTIVKEVILDGVQE